MLNYNHLHYFHVAAVEGSVAAAAEHLGVTQPTVSEQVRALEKTLGVSLFERSPAGLKLTEAGKLAFEHTSVMFRAGERLIESISGDRDAVPRTLRVGLSSAVARSTSTDFLMPLLAIADCTPSIQVGDANELIRLLRANELDLVLAECDPPEASRPGLEVALIDQTQLVAIAPPELQPSADWHDVSLLQYRASSAYRWEVETFLNTKNYRPQVAAEADDSLFLLEAAARGGHVAFVPKSIARDAIRTGRLRVVAHAECTHCGVHALYQSSDATGLARRAVEILIEHARIADE